ncbi:MAG: gliding motility-associated C-terminal domain-containing protein [Bacteroidota bacterium]
MFLPTAQARHLVGGELIYRCLGKDANGDNRYLITVLVYRDCRATANSSTNTPFDDLINVYVYRASDLSPMMTQPIGLDDQEDVVLTSADTCVAPPTNLCYARGIYETEIVLPDDPNGYHLVWGRCCRNESIVNLVNPGAQGMALTAKIPNTALCNNSPVFTQNLPTYICINDRFTFDHSAVDPDGDSLVYEITTPFTEGSQAMPQPIAGPPPHTPVPWAGGYSLNNIMDGSPSLNINQATGELSVRPTVFGQFVFSVSVYEYRNGVLISELKRDIQVNVINCPINYPPELEEIQDPRVDGRTFRMNRGEQNCFNITVVDNNGPGVKEDTLRIRLLGPLTQAPYDLSFEGLASGLSPIEGSVCWTPNCDTQLPDQNYFIIESIDNNDCPGPNVTLDTFFVELNDPPLLPPQLLCVSPNDPQSIRLTWEPIPETSQLGFDAYRIYRFDGTSWVPVADVTDPNQSTFVDQTAADAQNVAYCYRLSLLKTCPVPEESALGNEVCSEVNRSTRICRTTVDESGKVALYWTASTLLNFRSYRIYRQDPGSVQERLVAEIGDQTAEAWVDSTLDATEGSFCYRIEVTDPCGFGISTERHCTIPLTPTRKDFGVDVSWGAYVGWPDPLLEYEVWRRVGDGDEELIYTNFGDRGGQFLDEDLNNEEGIYCYRIRVIAPTGVCAPESWSASMCVPFEPIIYIPNAFTPNDDGRNDAFGIKEVFVQEFRLQVFDRWGRLIFTALSPDQWWDGTFKGRAVPEGVYMYRLDLTGFSGESFQRTGSITLIR